MCHISGFVHFNSWCKLRKFLIVAHATAACKVSCNLTHAVRRSHRCWGFVRSDHIVCPSTSESWFVWPYREQVIIARCGRRWQMEFARWIPSFWLGCCGRVPQDEWFMGLPWTTGVLWTTGVCRTTVVARTTGVPWTLPKHWFKKFNYFAFNSYKLLQQKTAKYKLNNMLHQLQQLLLMRIERINYSFESS